jgi:hypothetical protein
MVRDLILNIMPHITAAISGVLIPPTCGGLHQQRIMLIRLYMALRSAEKDILMLGYEKKM